MLYAFLICLMVCCMLHISNPLWIDHCNRNGEEHKFWSTSFCRFPQPLVSFSLVSPNILHSTLSWNTLNLSHKYYVGHFHCPVAQYTRLVFKRPRVRFQPSPLISKQSSNDRGIQRQTHRQTCPTILLLLRVFVAAGTCLPSRCLAMKGGIFTAPFLSNDRRDIHRLMGGVYEVRRWDELRCHDIHTKFVQIGSGIQKWIGGGIHRHTDSMEIA
jgi:hypothetical protein